MLTVNCEHVRFGGNGSFSSSFLVKYVKHSYDTGTTIKNLCWVNDLGRHMGKQVNNTNIWTGDFRLNPCKEQVCISCPPSGDFMLPRLAGQHCMMNFIKNLLCHTQIAHVGALCTKTIGWIHTHDALIWDAPALVCNNQTKGSESVVPRVFSRRRGLLCAYTCADL